MVVVEVAMVPMIHLIFLILIVPHQYVLILLLLCLMILLVYESGILPVLLVVQVAPEVLEEQGIPACSCLKWTCHAVLV